MSFEVLLLLNLEFLSYELCARVIFNRRYRSEVTAKLLLYQVMPGISPSPANPGPYLRREFALKRSLRLVVLYLSTMVELVQFILDSFDFLFDALDLLVHFDLTDCCLHFVRL